MYLSKVVKKFNGKLVRDGEFKRLDYCTVYENGPFLTFMEREKFFEKLSNNMSVSCVICKEDFVNRIPSHINGIFVCENPKACFEEIHNMLADSKEYMLPSFKTQIGNNCEISPLAFISEKNVIIEDNVKIGPFCFIGEHTTINNNCIIYNHATIGGRSFSYARKGDDDVVGLRDCGTVVLDEGVEVMSYSHIARGILPTDCTYIGKKTIIDAHVQISHGVNLSERVFVAAGTVIGGNTRIGRDSWIGLNATVSNRITIGEQCRVSLGAVVTKNVSDGVIVSGNFAIDHEKFLRNIKNSCN